VDVGFLFARKVDPMTLYIISAVIVGALGALLFLALHRANDAMTRRNLAGSAHNTPERTTGHLWASSDAGARPGPAMAVTGHSTRAFADAVTLRHSTDRGRDGLLLEGQYREYSSSVPRVVRGKTTVRTYRSNRLGPGAATVGAVEIVNTTPHREPNPGADLIVPFGQALVTGIIAMGLCGVLAAVAGRTDTLRVMAVSFVIVLAGSWLWRLGVVDSLLSVVERITQEIDGDEEEAEDPAHAMLENSNQARQAAGRIAGEHARLPDALCGRGHV
jgi:hypothetical protein